MGEQTPTQTKWKLKKTSDVYTVSKCCPLKYIFTKGKSDFITYTSQPATGKGPNLPLPLAEALRRTLFLRFLPKFHSSQITKRHEINPKAIS